jgi:hypothetical protein
LYRVEDPLCHSKDNSLGQGLHYKGSAPIQIDRKYILQAVPENPQNINLISHNTSARMFPTP